MLQRLFLFPSILFLLLLNISLVAIPPTKEEEIHFLEVIKNQIPNIIDNHQEIDGNFLAVAPLIDGGASFINSVYLVTTTTGKELIIKIGNPTWTGLKTMNEVSALTYLRKNSSIPVPQVFAYETDAQRSFIGTEYIIMPRIQGKPLSSEINRIYNNKKIYRKILDQLAEIIIELKKHQFSSIGNFLPFTEKDSKLQLGGIVDFPNYKMDQPCKSYSEYAKHSLNYYINEMRLLISKGSLEAPIYSYYLPILLNILNGSHFKSLDLENDQFVFSHQDFVMKNILVDQDKVTAILDWEWSGSALMEIEQFTGFDFLLNEDDRRYFSKKLEALGLKDFFQKPNIHRNLFYRFIGNIYTLVAFREWREGKLEHTAKFLSQKLEQRRIRNSTDFNYGAFLQETMQDLDDCIQEFQDLSDDITHLTQQLVFK